MDNQSALVFGSIISMGIIITTISVAYLAKADKPTQVPQTPPASIEISGLKESYRVGERLNFTINTYGICATPNLGINRYDSATSGSILVYEYGAEPVHCGPFLGPAAEHHFIWYADRLVTRISDEAYGGEGNSLLTASGAITLKKPGSYTISATLMDLSDNASADFTVKQ